MSFDWAYKMKEKEGILGSRDTLIEIRQDDPVSLKAQILKITLMIVNIRFQNRL